MGSVLGGDGWIVAAPFRRLTPNRYSKAFQANRIQPVEFIVYHFTAGGFDGSLRWLTSKDSSVSAHFIIKKDGDVWQLAPLMDRTWHAGGPTSKWRDKGQVNNRSIGIEIENWGKLTTRPNGAFFTYKGVEHKGATEVSVKGEVWDAYAEEQYLALERVTTELAQIFPQLLSAGVATGPRDGRFVGHEHVDPARKVDPGPTFKWPRIIAAAQRT